MDNHNVTKIRVCEDQNADGYSFGYFLRAIMADGQERDLTLHGHPKDYTDHGIRQVVILDCMTGDVPDDCPVIRKPARHRRPG